MNSNCDIVVIDDGSKDDTAINAKKENVRVISFPYNRGVAHAVKTGYMYAQENGYDIAIQLDADGQHGPEFIDRLVTPIRQEECDMAIGSRYVSTDSQECDNPKWSITRFFSFYIRLLFNLEVKDTTSGYRAVSRRLIEEFSRNYPSKFPDIAVFMIIKKKGFKVLEVPITMYERMVGKSSITILKRLYYVLNVSCYLLINYLKSKELRINQ